MGAEDTAVRYIGGHDEVEIDVTGQVVARGGVILVPTEVAGRPPKLVEAEDGGEVMDHGEGLLAQPSNWEKARKSDVPKPDEGDDPVDDSADDKATAADSATVEKSEG